MKMKKALMKKGVNSLINLKTLDKKYSDICIEYKSQFSTDYKKYLGHSFILFLFDFFDKLFANENPKIEYINNKYHDYIKELDIGYDYGNIFYNKYIEL